MHLSSFEILKFLSGRTPVFLGDFIASLQTTKAEITIRKMMDRFDFEKGTLEVALDNHPPPFDENQGGRI